MKSMANHVRLVVTATTDEPLTYGVEFIDSIHQTSMIVSCMDEQDATDLLETAIDSSNLLLRDKFYITE